MNNLESILAEVSAILFLKNIPLISSAGSITLVPSVFVTKLLAKRVCIGANVLSLSLDKAKSIVLQLIKVLFWILTFFT